MISLGLGVFILALVLIIYSICASAVSYYKIKFFHETSVAILIGLGLSALLRFGFNEPATKIDEENFIYYFLPPILFAEGLNVKCDKFFKHIRFINYLGFFQSIIIFSILYGLNQAFNGTYLFYGKNFKDYELLLLAAVLTFKDTTIQGQIVDHHKHETLHTISYGEGLLNEALVITLFEAITDNVANFNFGNTLIWFSIYLIVSALIGIAFGVACTLMLKHMVFMKQTPVFELLFIFFTAISAYSLTESIHFLGAISILSCSIVIGQFGWYNLSQRSKTSINVNFQTLANAAEGCMFFFIGFSCFNYTEEEADGESSQKIIWPFVMVIFEILFIILLRFIFVYVICWVNIRNNKGQIELKERKKKDRFPLNIYESFILYFSGTMRGVLAYIFIESEYPSNKEESILMPNYDVISTTVYWVVVITTLVNGNLLPLAENCFHLTLKEKRKQELEITHKLIKEEEEKKEEIKMQKKSKILYHFLQTSGQYNDQLFSNRREYCFERFLNLKLKPFLIFEFLTRAEQYEFEKNYLETNKWDMRTTQKDKLEIFELEFYQNAVNKFVQDRRKSRAINNVIECISQQDIKPEDNLIKQLNEDKKLAENNKISIQQFSTNEIHLNQK